MELVSPSEVTEVAIIGAGTMGHGIAQVFAISGYKVTLVDVSEDVLGDAIENVEESLERLGADTENVVERITTTTDREGGIAGVDVMVEAVPEHLELKERIFATADEVLPKHAVMATNTSTLPITEIAAGTESPERVVGMHFSNPVPLMEIVEVTSGEKTSRTAFEFIEELSEHIGKTPVLVKKDVPGFMLNRINYAFWSEALRAIDNEGQTPATVDAAVRRLGFPMGPFEVLDFSGIDVFHMCCQSMQERGVPIYLSDTLEELFEAGQYGMKTGEGFYEYPEPGEYKRVDIPLDRRYEFDPYRMIASAVNEAAWLLENDVTTEDDIDTAMQIGMSWPRGLLEFADEYGIDRVVDKLNGFNDESGREQYEPSPLLEGMVEDDRLGLKTGEGFYEHDYESQTFEAVEYERREFFALVTLSRPETLNAMNAEAFLGFRAALQRAKADDEVRATIIRGAGGAFSAGDDIAEMAEWESAQEGSEYFTDVVFPTIEELRTHPKPTIALVDGVATGMGCEMVLLSDMAVAADGSQFGQPEATIGALPPIWLTSGLTGVGKKKQLELAMTGDLMPASETEQMGLVNYAVSVEQAPDVARELARSTTQSAPGALEAITDVWTHIEDDLADAWLEYATEELTKRLQTEEGQHGCQAFLANETPRWEL